MCIKRKEKSAPSSSNTKKRTIIKVGINSEKCKTDIMTAVAKLKGVNQLALDGAAEKLTVIGDVNPVVIVKKIKKIDKDRKVDILSVQTVDKNYDFSRRSDVCYRGNYRYNDNCESSYYDCHPSINRPPPPACHKECEVLVYENAPGICSIL